jgi:uncharacterized OB-fold protein
MNEAYAKPLPQPTIDSKPFWDGLKEHRMVLQKCADCGRVRHYPRPVCDACLSMEVEWAEASGRGTVYSWTETHHPFHAGFRGETPYILVTVDLDEGVRMQSQLIDASIDELRVGLPVEVVYMDATDEVTLPLLRIVR